MAARIRCNDEVIVITGKDKGKTGKVVRVFPSDHKVLVEGINLKKKHQKANPNANIEGGIVEKEAPIDVSNVAIYNSATNKADKVGFRFDENGVKVRYFKSTNEVIPNGTSK